MTRGMQLSDIIGSLEVHVEGGNLASKKHWWKIDNGLPRHYRGYSRIRYLEIHNFAFDKQGDRDITYLCTRAQRGLISYHNCSMAELRKFCRQQDLSFSGPQGDDRRRVTKDQLRDLLEFSDEKATFPKFLELPPELRVLDKSKKQQTWLEIAFELQPPPIASVSKLLRQKSLPMFYSSGVLRIYLTRVYDHREPRTMTEFFGVAPLAVIEAVKRFDIVVRMGFNSKDKREDNVVWSVTLPQAAGASSHHVSYEADQRNFKGFSVPIDRLRRFDEALKDILSGMGSRERTLHDVKLRRGEKSILGKQGVSQPDNRIMVLDSARLREMLQEDS